MRKVWLLIFLLVIGVRAWAQNATVTFYAPGGAWTGVGKEELTLGGYAQLQFMGSIFDGDARIGTLRGGHFVTLIVPAGHHVFSASYNLKHPAGNALLPLDLDANKSYFINLRTKRYGALFVMKLIGEIQDRTCRDAFSAASGFTPAPAKWIEKDWRERLVNSPYFPKCEAVESTASR